jgi:hypothetical protein
MTEFDYKMPGEFYSRDSLRRGSKSLNYRRFDTVAEAIRFAMEDLPSAAVGSCMLEANGERFGARELRELYASPRYPLARPTLRKGENTSENGSF